MGERQRYRLGGVLANGAPVGWMVVDVSHGPGTSDMTGGSGETRPGYHVNTSLVPRIETQTTQT